MPNDNPFEDYINRLPIDDPFDDAIHRLEAIGERWVDLPTPQQAETLRRLAVALHKEFIHLSFREMRRLIVYSWYILLATDDTIVRRTSEDNHADPDPGER